MNKSFLTLSKKDCVKVSEETLRNAEKHLELGEKLYLLREYGFAISHVILGSEELIKTLFLHLDGVGFSFRQIKGMKSIFINHQLRYFVSFLIFCLSIVSDELKQIVEKIKKKEICKEDIKGFVTKILQKDKDFEAKLMKKVIIKIEFLLNEINWFKNFDLFRQKGFYVDYNDKVETPLNASENDYTSIRVRVDRVKRTINEIIKNLNYSSPENIEIMEEMMEKIDKRNFYDSIGKFIQNVQLSKSNALDYTFNSIRPMLDDAKKDLQI